MADDKRIARRWGAAIRERRLHRRMTVPELAAAVGVTRQAVYQWEDGLTMPTPQRQVAIAKALDIPVRLLFSLEAA
jgi:transcriptional regulator with XRE-family HTH domain